MNNYQSNTNLNFSHGIDTQINYINGIEISDEQWQIIGGLNQHLDKKSQVEFDGVTIGDLSKNISEDGNLHLNPTDEKGATYINWYRGGTLYNGNGNGFALGTFNTGVINSTNINAANLSLSGNLYIAGNITEVNTTAIEIKDSIIELANDNTDSDVIDSGWYSVYSDGKDEKYRGIIYDVSDSSFKMFTNLDTKPTTTLSGTFNNANIQCGNINGVNIEELEILINDISTELGEFENLTTDEIKQLENINTNVITPTNWSYLSSTNQHLATNSDVQFNKLNIGPLADLRHELGILQINCKDTEFIYSNYHSGQGHVFYNPNRNDGEIIAYFDGSATHSRLNMYNNPIVNCDSINGIDINQLNTTVNGILSESALAYEFNQNLRTTDNPTFNNMQINGNITQGSDAIDYTYITQTAGNARSYISSYNDKLNLGCNYYDINGTPVYSNVGAKTSNISVGLPGISLETNNVNGVPIQRMLIDSDGKTSLFHNGSTLNLVGDDHTYIAFYPDGPSVRKAYLGF
jgi:hypothetical protein